MRDEIVQQVLINVGSGISSEDEDRFKLKMRMKTTVVNK
jgi:hypothetical protein